MSGHKAWVVGMVAAAWVVLCAPASFAPPFFFESFDGVEAPALPDGWAQMQITGAGGEWSTSTSAGDGDDPYSGSNCGRFNSASVAPGVQWRLYRTAGADLSSIPSTVALRFWMYHSPTVNEYNDLLQPIASFDGGSTWYAVSDWVSRWSPTTGWKQHIINADFLSGYSDVRLGFTGLAGGSADIFIDDIELANALAGCSPNVGTIGTKVALVGTGFGDVPGKLAFYGTKTKPPFTVTSWTNTRIEFVMAKKCVATEYEVVVHPKVGPSVSMSAYFTVQPPMFFTIDPDTASIGDTITVNGIYFGTKAGKISLVSNAGPKPVRKSCKPVTWVMDNATNTGSATFLVPKGVLPGAYDLVISNDIGTATSVGGLTVE